MWIYDMETLRYLKVNQEAIKIYGYSEEEFLAMTILDIRPSSEVPKLKKALKELKEGRLPQEHGVFKHRKKNGELMDVLIKGSTILYEGRKCGVITGIDQTERYQLIRDLTIKNSLLDLMGQLNALYLSSSSYQDILIKVMEEIRRFFSPSFVAYYEKSGEEGNRTVFFKKEVVGGKEDESVLVQEIVLENPLRTFIVEKKDFLQPLFSHHKIKESEVANSVLIPVIIGNELLGFIILYNIRLKEEGIKTLEDFFDTIGKKLSVFAEKWKLLDTVYSQKNKFRKLIHESADIIAILTPEAKFTYLSPNIQAILGYGFGELLEKSVLDFIHPSDREMVLKEFELIVTLDSLKLSPFRFRDKAGNYSWIRTILTNKLEDPLIQGVIANSFEINLLKAQQEEIEMVNERYRLAASASKDLIFDIDVQTGRATVLGKGLETVFGYTQEETSPFTQSFWELKIHPEDIKGVLWRRSQYLENASEKNLVLNYRLKKGNGQFAHVIDSSSAIRDASGKAIRLVGSIRDITKVKQQSLIDQLKYQVANDIAQASTLKAAFKRGVERILQGELGLTHMEVWVKSVDGKRLDLTASLSKCPPNKTVKSFDQPIKELKRGEGFAGAVWEALKHMVWENLTAYPDYQGNALVKSAIIKHGLGMPIIYNQEVLGVVLCFTDGDKGLLTELVDFLWDLVEWIGPVLKNRLTQEELGFFLKVSTDLLVVLSSEGQVLKSNKAFLQLTGYDTKDLLKRNFRSLFTDPEDKDLRTLTEPTKPVNSVVCPLSAKGGESQWIEWNRNYDEQNNLIYLTGRDITEKRQRDQDLQGAFDKLDKAQRIAKLGYWSRKLEDDVSEWTEETYKIYGYSPADFIPTYKNVLSTFHPEDCHMMRDADLSQLPSGEVLTVTHRIITASKEVRWVAQHINLVKDEEGVPYRIEGVVQDITELKKASEKLRASNERFELALKAANELIWDIDLDKGEVFRSKAFEGKLDYKHHEKFQYQNSWQSIVDPQDKERIWKSFVLTCSKRHKNYWREEYRIKNKQGKYLHVIDRCFILRDEKGQPYRMVGAIQDVTASKTQMKTIHDQNIKLREIAWQQSHEVRGPLAQIMSLISYYDEFRDTEDIDNIMELIRKACEKLDEVIQAITEKTYALDEENEGDK
ncbi:hypothetical protein GCM10028791_20780 [Echinicola sediminis]